MRLLPRHLLQLGLAFVAVTQLAAEGERERASSTTSPAARDVPAASMATARAWLGSFSARSRVDPATPQVVRISCETDAPRRVLLRAIGRGLPGAHGVNALPTPVLSLYRETRLLAEDRGSAISGEMAALAHSAGAFPVGSARVPAFSNHGSALAPQLGRGEHIVVVTSGDDDAGNILFECHEIAPAPGSPLVRSLSLRGHTGPGDAVMIVGFIICGDAPLQLLVRALGPALGSLGIARPVADPRLELYAAGATAPLARNEDWAGNAEVAAAARRVQASPLPAASRDAALLITLAPGTYTALLPVTGNVSGNAMLELYVVE